MFGKHQNNQRKAPEELVTIAKREIQNVLFDVSGVSYVMLCSTDGFEIASVNKRDVNNSGKLAAVSSSILAMVSAFVNEIQLVGCQSVTLDAENGKAILTSIPARNHPMIIVTISARDVLLGQLLHAVKRASDNIALADSRISR
ncbi:MULTISPECIES: roadblock/LC7 domain-containing protein [unclassified Acinetobacter]|uniref:roadblock/LC7 domain-containing protein n=1 Tax=unclassified Acinetobacter TaxID=196816 RepID=UPI0035BAFAEC